MTIKRRPLLFGLAGFFLAALMVGLAVGALLARPYAFVGAAYKAKYLCSEIYVAGRTPEAVLAADFDSVSPVLPLVSTHIDPARRTVTSALFGLGRSRAMHRPGYGCSLVIGRAPDPLPKRTPVAPKPWPETDAAVRKMLKPAIDTLISDANRDPRTGHRAVAVFVNGAIAYEWYTDGFSADTRFIGWSSSKSIAATTAGIAAHKGLLDIKARAPIAAWKNAGDKRNAITWTHLLNMTSGLRFDETYDNPRAEATKMLFRARRMADVAANAPLDHPPGTYWSYSSGTTNLLQMGLRNTLENAGRPYHAFVRDTLFEPLGLASAVFETDAAGDFVGSSYLYATARDWGKLGQLYLQDGVWDGARLLPRDWVSFVTTPTTVSDNEYGAHFWLNKDGLSGRQRDLPSIPDTAYMMKGHYGQYVVILPSINAVIVRFGLTPTNDPFAISGPLFEDIYALIANAS